MPMLPNEPVLALHRLPALMRPARTQETTAVARPGPSGSVPVSNAAMAQSMYVPARVSPAVVQDQLGNTAMTKAAAQAHPAVPLIVMPVKPTGKYTPGR